MIAQSYSIKHVEHCRPIKLKIVQLYLLYQDSVPENPLQIFCYFILPVS